LKHRANPLENLLAESREFSAPVIDNRGIHRAQDAIGHVCGTWNLKKVASGMNHVGSV
jgi:hypothetical protein